MTTLQTGATREKARPIKAMTHAKAAIQGWNLAGARLEASMMISLVRVTLFVLRAKEGSTE